MDLLSPQFPPAADKYQFGTRYMELFQPLFHPEELAFVQLCRDHVGCESLCVGAPASLRHFPPTLKQTRIVAVQLLWFVRRKWLHWREGAGEFYQGAGDCEARNSSKRGEHLLSAATLNLVHNRRTYTSESWLLQPYMLHNLRIYPLMSHTCMFTARVWIVPWRSTERVLIVLCFRCKCLYLIWLQDPSHAAFKEKMKEFMASFDKNSDGRIEMLEVIFFIWFASLWQHNSSPTEVKLTCQTICVTVLTCLFVLHAPVGSAFAHRRKLPSVFQRVCRIQLWVYGCKCVYLFWS